MNVHVNLINLNKQYGKFYAVQDLNLEIEKGSFTCLLGPSGCGKTTTLRMIAGFIEPTGGDITISGKSQQGIPPYKRNTSIVFQEYALFPHMSVRENIGYGLKIKKLSKSEIVDKVNSMMNFLGLETMADRQPKFLSGGQQQRVALGRSLVMEPEVLLMDEPLSNLDAKMRIKVRAELKDIQRRLGLTTIYVTHDQEEALSISDRIAVMDSGVLQQYGTPWDLYFNSANKFVAAFIGTNNFITGEVRDIKGNKAFVRVADQVADQVIEVDCNRYIPEVGKQATLSVRPESIKLKHSDGSNCFINGRIRFHTFLGAIVRYWVNIGDKEIIVDDHNPQDKGILSGDVNVVIESTGTQVFPHEQ